MAYHDLLVTIVVTIFLFYRQKINHVPVHENLFYCLLQNKTLIYDGQIAVVGKRCEKDDFGQAEEIKKEHVVSNSSAVM